MIVSSMLIGAVIGTANQRLYHVIMAGVLPFISAIIFCVGALLSAGSVSATMLILVRVFLGMAMGLALTAPLFGRSC